MVSSLLDEPVSNKVAFLGEVGLGGEIRAVNKVDHRLGEIQKMGFEKAIIPQASSPERDHDLRVIESPNIMNAIKKAL